MAIDALRNQLTETYDKLYHSVDNKTFPDSVDSKKVLNMMNLTLQGLMSERIHDASFQPDLFYKEACGYIDLMEKIVGRVPQ